MAERFDTIELIFHGNDPIGSETEATFSAVFQNGEQETVTEGFYKGNGIYCVRFYANQEGFYSWKVTGIPNVKEATEGTFTCTKSSNDRHGMVKTKGLKFCYEDETNYIPFGTTVYALVHQEQEILDETFATLQEAPFNKIRFCIFPKHYNFNQNDPEHFPFRKDGDHFNYHQPDYDYWNRLDETIRHLNQMQIEADLILFHPYDKWGFSKMTEAESMVYLSYLIRRLGSFPNVWWSLANEYDLMHAFEEERWDHIADFIGSKDQNHHLLSNHDWVTPWKFEHPYVTHCCLQDSDARKIPVFQSRYKKPVIFDEMGYEGNIPFEWGNLSGFELVNRFWKTYTYGGYASHGETFINGMSDDQVLWWSKGGTLKGESSKRISYLKTLFESFSGTLELYTPKSAFSFSSREELKLLIDKKTSGIFDNDVLLALLKLDDMEFQRILSILQPPIVHYQEDVFLTYYGSMCTSVGMITLPENQNYCIEIIDVWNMTREVVLEKASGSIEVTLPGKEGITLLATRLGD